jgi:hypothetical protein
LKGLRVGNTTLKPFNVNSTVFHVENTFKNVFFPLEMAYVISDIAVVTVMNGQVHMLLTNRLDGVK